MVYKTRGMIIEMSVDRSEKERAYLYDLYVAPDWSERFAVLIDEHMKLPEEARVLYVGAGTGGHALALAERAAPEVSFVGVDESAERVALAEAKAVAANLNARVEFRLSQLETLDFADDEFDSVIGDASLVATERLPEILAEMTRVARNGATVALNLITSSSFGEFFSIYWEALTNTGLEAHAAVVESLITELPTITDIESLAAREGLDQIQSWTNKEEFNFKSGEDFTAAPLINDFLFRRWLEPLPDDERGRIIHEVERIINEERQDADWAFSIKATLVSGRKAE